METADYIPIVQAGAEGLVVYQETYDRKTYAELHTSGPKRDFNWRLDCAQRGYEAGFRRLGIGALFGLTRWQEEALSLAAHVEYLLKHCWQAQITVSLPRLRPAAGEFHPAFSMTDRELAQLICAFRISFPEVGIVLSTRERAALRDALAPLGVTMMSAGSHTEPGGYTGQGSDDLHRTVRGKNLRQIRKKARDGLPRVNSRSAMSARPRKLRQFPRRGLSRSGKAGMPGLCRHESLGQRRTGRDRWRCERRELARTTASSRIRF